MDDRNGHDSDMSGGMSGGMAGGGASARLLGELPVILFKRRRLADGSVRYPFVRSGARDLLEGIQGGARLLFNRIPPADRTNLDAAIERSAVSMEPLHEEFQVALDDGSVRWFSGVSRPRAESGGAVRWDGILMDVTERYEAAERLSFLAFNDPVTGLLNRVGFEDRFSRLVQEHDRPGSMLAVLSFGLDRFNTVNETLGHGVGDAILRVAGQRVAAQACSGAAVARVGGNTMAVLLPPASDRQQAMAMAESILGGFQTPVQVDDHFVDVSASAGIAMWPVDGEDVATLLKNAGIAMNRVQRSDPGGVMFFEEKMVSGALQAFVMQGRLNQALRHGEFTTYFQPQVDIASGQVVCLEALVRWNDPHLGIVNPDEFIGVAEDIGLIGAIGESVLRMAATTAMDWRREGLDVPRIAVNISPRQFARPRRLLASLETVLKETGLEPRHIELELTESSLLWAPEEAVPVMESMVGMGVSLALDDFGVGYSSLGRLKSLPITKLKVDRGFVLDISRDAGSAAIVRAIIVLAKAMGMTAAAEGVEDSVQLAFLRDEGCDLAQGTLISAPLPAPGVRRMLQNQTPLLDAPGR